MQHSTAWTSPKRCCHHECCRAVNTPKRRCDIVSWKKDPSPELLRRHGQRRWSPTRVANSHLSFCTCHHLMQGVPYKWTH